MNRKATLTGVLAFANAILFTCAVHSQTLPVDTWIAVTKPGIITSPNNYTIATSTTPASTNFTTLTSFTPTRDINGIGINPKDSLLYGAAYVGNFNVISSMLNVNFYRLNANGVMTNLGKLPTTGKSPFITSSTLGISVRAEIPNFSAGTLDADGRYYYTNIGIKQSGVNKILQYFTIVNTTNPNYKLNLTTSDLRLFFCWLDNVKNMTDSTTMPTAPSGFYELNFSNANVTTALQSFLTSFNNLFPDSLNFVEGGIQDFAVHPINSRVYGYIAYNNASNNLVGRPMVFNAPNPGDTITAISTVGTTINAVPGYDVAGVQFDDAGNFYGLFNNGSYGTINLSPSGTGSGAVSLAPTNLANIGGELRGDLASGVTGTFVLPVDLVSFTGSAFKGYNELNWTVTASSNGRTFVVERSADGKAFAAIGTVNFSKGLSKYSFQDRQPGAMNYYRLRLTDADGNSKYSPAVTLASMKEGEQVRIYPTVATERSLHIATNAREFSVAVYNMTGKLVLSHNISQAGNDFILNMPQLASGNYIIQVKGISDPSIAHTEKFLVP